MSLAAPFRRLKILSLRRVPRFLRSQSAASILAKALPSKARLQPPPDVIEDVHVDAPDFPGSEVPDPPPTDSPESRDADPFRPSPSERHKPAAASPSPLFRPSPLPRSVLDAVQNSTDYTDLLSSPLTFSPVPEVVVSSWPDLTSSPSSTSAFLPMHGVSRKLEDEMAASSSSEEFKELRKYLTPRQLSKCRLVGPIDVMAVVCKTIRELQPGETMDDSTRQRMNKVLKGVGVKPRVYFFNLAWTLTQWKAGEEPFTDYGFIRRLLQLAWTGSPTISAVGDLLTYFEAGGLMRELATGSRAPIILSSPSEARHIHERTVRAEPWHHWAWAERVRHEYHATPASMDLERDALQAQMTDAIEQLHAVVDDKDRGQRWKAEAARVLGPMYVEGVFVERDLDRAKSILEKGVNEHTPAGRENAFRLARAYMGEGNRITSPFGPQPFLPRDGALAERYYELCARENPVAAYELGELYHFCARRTAGHWAHRVEFGVRAHEMKAREMVGRAAERRYKRAVRRYEEMFWKGRWEKTEWLPNVMMQMLAEEWAGKGGGRRERPGGEEEVPRSSDTIQRKQDE